MTKDYTLVAVDVSGIQDFVFRTNKLQHQVGASELVRCATSTWVRQHLPKPNNMTSDEELLDDRRIERGELQAEVLYSGGGNAVILFPDQTTAGAFIKSFTRTVLLEAPGLNVAVAEQPFIWREDGSDLGEQVAGLLGSNLRRKKQAGRANGELPGLSVTADCEFTGLPAIRRDDEGQRISAEITAKLNAKVAAGKRLEREIGGDKYVEDFNDFGTKGESSYIAVIHTDGNSMGRRFEAVAQAGLRNREYIRAVRALSQSVNRAAQNALKATVNAIRTMPTDESERGRFSPFRNGKLLFRPIIFGGDDATFVCDGRLGLAAAAYYLKQFSEQKLKEHAGETHPAARAGVAVVKSHFPFGQAYHLAEELAQSAKKFSNEGKHSVMDWHFGVNGVVSDIETMRQRVYVAQDGAARHSLLMRPLRLEDPSVEWRNWKNFENLVNNLEHNLPKNKIKALREALRGGPNAAKRYIQANLLDDEKNRLTTDTGWIGEHCALFDPIEAMDFFKRLETADTGARV